jgi:protoheme IX farnesyltransferase
MNLSALKSYGELCKLRVSIFSALSAATGFILAGSGLYGDITIPVLGVLFLSCGASALNQFQERNTDAQMTRTKKRPIPDGRIIPRHAVYFSLFLLSSGLLILSLSGNSIVPVIGFCAVLWYNGIYTNLKRITAFAAVPGALIGTLPPAIGWLTGGGDLLDHRLSAICFFFFMWQVPHFWLFLLAHSRDYERAELPSLTEIFSKEQLARIIFTWILAVTVCSFMIPLWTTALSEGIFILLVGTSLWLVRQAIRLFGKNEGIPVYTIAFKRINTYMLLIMLFLNFNSLFF